MSFVLYWHDVLRPMLIPFLQLLCYPLYHHVICHILFPLCIMSSILSIWLHSSDFLQSLILSSVTYCLSLHYIIYSPSNHHFLHSIILPPFYDVSSTPSFKLKHSESVSTFPWSTLHNLYPGEKQWGPGDLWVLFSGKNGEWGGRRGRGIDGKHGLSEWWGGISVLRMSEGVLGRQGGRLSSKVYLKNEMLKKVWRVDIIKFSIVLVYNMYKYKSHMLFL